MERRSFLKLFLGGSVVVAVGPGLPDRALARTGLPKPPVVPVSIPESDPFLAAGFFVSLHTKSPRDYQDDGEAGFLRYARVAVPRSSKGWNVQDGWASNAQAILFQECTGGSSLITHIGVGTSLEGPGALICSGPLQRAVLVSAGITVVLSPGNFTMTLENLQPFAQRHLLQMV